MKFINAKEGPPNAGSKIYTVHYFDEKGNMTIHSGGTKAWRNNNPGNMKYKGGFAVRHGGLNMVTNPLLEWLKCMVILFHS
jgi:hypothetical protein